MFSQKLFLYTNVVVRGAARGVLLVEDATEVGCKIKGWLVCKTILFGDGIVVGIGCNIIFWVCPGAGWTLPRS